MKKQFALFISLISFFGYSQINFEQGYIIDGTGQEKAVLIKNLEWKDSPESFEYKTDSNSEINIGNLQNIKEFGINNQARYIRVTIDIDRSSDITSQLTYTKNPSFNKETIFLKVLLESKASLYMYESGNLTRFFYNLEDDPIQQLVFKNYKISNFKMGTNEQYKQDLYNNLKCESITLKEVEDLEYQKTKLLKFFNHYNECQNSTVVEFGENKKTDFFHLTIRPGINSASLSIENSLSDNRNADFDNKLGFRIGLEAEMILPFNKNKWSVFVEPTYQFYKSETENAFQKVEIDYSSIEVPLGIRHYFFLNDKSKIFINAALIYDVSLGSKVLYEKQGGDITLRSSINIGLGLGYNFNNTFSLEFRYQTNRNLLTNYEFYDSEYKVASLIFGYSIL